MQASSERLSIIRAFMPQRFRYSLNGCWRSQRLEPGKNVLPARNRLFVFVRFSCVMGIFQGGSVCRQGISSTPSYSLTLQSVRIAKTRGEAKRNMDHLAELSNPAWYATTVCQNHLANQNGQASAFRADISPFAAIASFDDFHALTALVPIDRVVGLLSPASHPLPNQTEVWRQIAEIHVHQMINLAPDPGAIEVKGQALTNADFAQMYQLAKLTDPGPFEPNTGEMGQYYGIFHNEKLIAMAGERLITPHWTEISAVCVHPDHEGKGHAKALMLQTMQGVAASGRGAFLHVRHGSPAEQRALGLYEKLGFRLHQQATVQLFQRYA